MHVAIQVLLYVLVGWVVASGLDAGVFVDGVSDADLGDVDVGVGVDPEAMRPAGELPGLIVSHLSPDGDHAAVRGEDVYASPAGGRA